MRLLVVALGSSLPLLFLASCELKASGERPSRDDSGADAPIVIDSGSDAPAPEDAMPDAFDAGVDAPVDAGPASPPEISGLFLWLRADKNVTLADGGSVDAGDGGSVVSWNDSSGASDVARNANAPTPLAMPTFVPQEPTLNGMPALVFGDYTRLVTGAINVNQPATVFLVGSAKAGGSSNKYFFDSLVPGAPFAVFCTPTDNAQLSAGVVTSLPTPTVSVPRVIVASFNGLNSRLFVSSNTGLTGNAGGGNTVGLTLGNYADGTFYSMKGPLAEFALWKRALTTLEITQLESYAANRYGLTITP